MSNPAPIHDALPDAGGSWLRMADGRIVRAEQARAKPERAKRSAEVDQEPTQTAAPAEKE